MRPPEIVYFQTKTVCNGHCHYCPFDDVYSAGVLPQSEMTFEIYQAVIRWLADFGYIGRLGFLLHYEPSLDNRLPDWITWTRKHLPMSGIEMATNGIKQPPELWNAVDVVDWVSPGKQTQVNSMAGNARFHGFNDKYSKKSCSLPLKTMCISATGVFLLCEKDWRHEIVVGTWKNISSARLCQLDFATKLDALEICRDCMSEKWAEDVGDRLGKRNTL